MRLGLADRRVALDFSGPPLAERVEVLLFVADLLNREHVDADAHLLEVYRRFAGQFLREALTIAVHLFNGQCPQDRPQVALQCLENHLLHFDRRHAQKALGRRLQRRLVAADLDVGHGLHRHGNTFERVRPLDFERDRHHVQVQVFDLLEQRDTQRGAAAHHAVADDAAVGELAAAPAEHRDGIRRHFQIVAADQQEADDESDQRDEDQRRDYETGIEVHGNLAVRCAKR